MGIYQQILQSKPIVSNNNPEQLELLLSGLVIKENNYLQVKNPIYQAVFNTQWVEQQLNNLRPYRIKFEAWLKDGTDSHLLTGLQLQEALAWAENKQLSDSDYRFLNASQQLTQQSTERDLVRISTEKEKAQFALYAVQEANRLIIVARHNAQKKVKQLRIPKSWIGIVAIAVFSLTIFLRQTGALQGLELTTLDLYFQQRPVVSCNRLTIITIDESDIQNLGQFPISDRILARSLNKLIAYQPRVIGLNLYRDLPIPPGETELQQLFTATHNLIGIEKVVGAKIPPPPALAKSDAYGYASANRVGFADQIFDHDGTIRRALLSIRNHQNVERSFALRLALKYLQAENIKPQPVTNPTSAIKLGKAFLVPFQGNDGSYVRADAGGYQILINYRSTLDRFTHYSLSQLLANKIPNQAIRDRIILIGSTADTTSDLSPTPFSTWQPGKQMAWVTIHANIISQLLSAAINGREMLHPVSEGFEWLCILISAVVGSYLSWRRRMFWIGATSLILILVTIIFLTYLTFLQGLWLPVMPMAIAFTVAAILVAIVTQRQLATMQLKETIRQLRIISQEQPVASKVAFELLKQGENQKNQELIEQLLS
ncbi:MAG: CHASE2 domain-containing protein [Pleurocapsa sp.]